MLGKIAFLVLIFALYLLFSGAFNAYKGWKNPEPTRTTVADYVNSDKSKEWVVLTDAKINLLDAVSTTTTTGYKIAHVPVGSTKTLSLYIPIKSAEFTQNDTVSLLLKTNDAELLYVARQLMAMSEAKSKAELLQFLVRERDKLIRNVELSGLMERGEGEEIRKHIKNLASNFYILKHNSTMSLTEGFETMGVGLAGLLMFAILIWVARRYG